MRFFLLIVFSIAILNPAWSGGPLLVNNGTTVLWPESKSSLVFTLDPGRLGTISYFRAYTLIGTAFDTWNKVSTSRLRFYRDSKTLSTDVTASNYNQILDNLPSGTNPIVFDDDGEIVDDLLGNNAKTYILGFASLYRSGNQIVQARAIFNGYFIREQSQTEDEVLSTLLHEIGHMGGLDHSQISREIAYNSTAIDDDAVPIMFPSSTAVEDVRKTLTLDDRLSISNLYPNVYHLNSSGSIAGTVWRGTRQLPGVNVIARNIADPLNQVASTVTGTLEPNKGSYQLKGLPPGDYEVMVEAIDPSFIGTSSVGQYAESSTGLSFQRQVRPEYYNIDDRETEGHSAASFVTVSKAHTVTGVDIYVDSQSLPDDEARVRLLAIGSQAAGGMGPSSNAPLFLLEPQGSEGALELTVTFSASTNYRIQVQRERSSGGDASYTFSKTALKETIVIGSGGSIPLENTRYFIEVTSFSSTDRTFIVAAKVLQAVPTATPAPSPTLTPTPTFTPTLTSTPLSPATPTFTPSPPAIFTPTPTSKPARTPTPVLPGDVNRDGRLDALDLFSFAQDWQKQASVIGFRSNLSLNRSLIIDRSDLLELIEIFRTAREP